MYASPTPANNNNNRKKELWKNVFLASIATAAVVSAVTFIIIFLKHQTPALKVALRATSVDVDSINVLTEKIALHKLYSLKKQLTEPSIFVAISSYRDSELCLTLENLYQNALHPERLIFGIVEQNDPSDTATCHAKNARIPQNQLRIRTLNYKEAQGPTYARYLCEQLWDGETYHMMTDSHMRSEPGWDCILIDSLYRCPRPHRTVLTCYPEGYERKVTRGGVISYQINMRKGFRYHRFKYFNDQRIPEFESVTTSWNIPEVPPLTPFWGACFHFSHSDSIRLVPFSPNTPYLFFGEEIFMSCRFFTSGWDLRVPRFSVVYHLWARNYRKTFWEVDVVKKRDQSIQLVKDIIMTGNVVDDVYGVGKQRSIQEFWDYVGLDPVAQKTTRPADLWTPGPNYKPICDEFNKDDCI